MPNYPKPSSPQKSQKNFEFKGKFLYASDQTVLEFNLTQQFPERRSAPPPETIHKLQAREMPDFSKFKTKQVESRKELTVPQGFELESEKRRK